MAATTLARLACDERTARRIATLLAESFDDAVGSAFETEGGWVAEVFFRTPPDRDAVRALAATGTGGSAALSFSEVDERDWIASSLAGLPPVRAGRFIVHGAHDRSRVAPNAIGIEIEAGLAFGTGHHGTTRGCLLALDAGAKRARARRVLDLGTGSGVLAIAAARLSKRKVVATDIDKAALACARDNARRNSAGALVTAVQASGCRGLDAHPPFDLIFANILLTPLLRMASTLARLVAPGGQIVLSGLVPAQANAILSTYRGLGLALRHRIVLEGWVTLVMWRGRR
jgi:ribosomal protein L11 methyltransferase